MSPSGNLQNGVLFHRWLPDGIEDALDAKTGTPNARLRFWFERCGYVDESGLVTYDDKRREVAPERMALQGKLESGPLLALLELSNVAKEDLDAVIEKKVGDPRYVELAKRLLKDFIYPHLMRLLTILRNHYGQYWINELTEWDPRGGRSLGAYCRSLNMHWSIDGGRTWSRFTPERNVQKIWHAPVDYREYITEQDWKELGTAMQRDYVPSVAAEMLGGAHALFDQGDLRRALVEGTTALELAVDNFVDGRLHGAAGEFGKARSAFLDLPLPHKVAVAASVACNVSPEDISRSLKAIELRNKVVHEGYEPDESASKYLKALFRTTAALLPEHRFKFPAGTSGNLRMPPEEWEKYPNTSPGVAVSVGFTLTAPD
jgi:hypothetical protein